MKVILETCRVLVHTKCLTVSVLDEGYSRVMSCAY